jgi:phenylacetate-CoA ligase
VNDPISLIRSALPGIAWPAIPPPGGAHALAMQFQLELTQWYTPDQLLDLQFRQLDELLRHACDTVPYYRERFRGIYDPNARLTPERFARLPVLTRGVLHESFDALQSAAPPPAHGPVVETRSADSTGTSLRVLKTRLCEILGQSTAMREHLWHRRDLTGKLAVIRRGIEADETSGWGPAVDVADTGRLVRFPASADAAMQLAWLEQQQPDYLLTYPSILTELASLALSRGTRFPRLREAMTMEEVLTPELRRLCRDAWGIPVVDSYSTPETGCLGLQCPGHEHYHVQSETVMVEVLNTRGKACARGEAGVVVVTPLHNFAMPLVRYVVGDYAEAGAQCACNRGLPVLRRSVGRVRNTPVTAAGDAAALHSAPANGLSPSLSGGFEMAQTAPDTAATAPAQLILIRSALPGVAWPAIARPEYATALALQYQLERSQWLAAEDLQALQFRQLGELLKHAYGTVPFYRWQWHDAYESARTVTPEAFARLPLLTRTSLQDQFEALKSGNMPGAHGTVTSGTTSGSTGRVVRTLKTDLTELWWQALTLRDHLWHRRDFSGKLAAIRQGVALGEASGWGPATDAIATAGLSATLPVSTDIETQLEWLQRQQPDYFLSYPSLISELAKRCIERGIRFDRLREVRTIGELLTDDVRGLCRQAWNVPVTDVYTSDEVGYIALQCPASGHYHAQSESLLVEVLDDAGNACPPGAVGRIAVTTLHNFAMPLVRYVLGDYAEVGPPCACGRGLPVLTRIMGRVRNMLRLASGACYWPSFGTRTFGEIAPLLQHQFVQKEFDLIEARLVTAVPLTADQENRLRRHILSRLPGGLRLTFTYCAQIPRGAGGKYEDFISEVSDGPTGA